MGGEDGAVQHAAAPRAQRNPGIADDPDEDRDVASDVLADRLLGKVAAQADAAQEGRKNTVVTRFAPVARPDHRDALALAQAFPAL